jgi:hypothetical protein
MLSIQIQNTPPPIRGIKVQNGYPRGL